MDEKHKKTYTVLNRDGKIEQVALCERYFNTKNSISFKDNILKYLIIGVNVVLKKAVVIIVDSVGCDTQSSEMSFVMMAVFFTTLFNTGFLLLIVNGNMSEQKGFPFHSLLNGDLTDFNEEWFVNMGDTICGSM